MAQARLPMHGLNKRELLLVNGVLLAGERVICQCVGAWGQALVLTDSKAIIAKCGIFAGQPFGGKVSIFEFRQITSIEIQIGVRFCVFEVLVAGVSSTRHTYFGNGDNDAFKAPNTVPFVKGRLADFQQTASEIRRRISYREVEGPATLQAPIRPYNGNNGLPDYIPESPKGSGELP